MKKILIISALIIGISSPAFAICTVGQSPEAFNACMERERQQRQMEQMQRQQIQNQQQMMRQQQQIINNQRRQQQQNNTVTVPQPNYPDPTGWAKPSFRTW